MYILYRRSKEKLDGFFGNPLSNIISALRSLRIIPSGQNATILFSRKYSYQKGKNHPNALDG